MVTGPVVVLVRTVEEKENRNAFSREIVMVGSEIEPLIGPDVIDGGHPEFGVASVHAIQRLAEVGMFLSDRHDSVFPVSTHHVRVQVGHNVLNRH